MGFLLISSAVLSLRVGGEWAGWCCAFSATSGAVQTIGDKYVTSHMLEWDQVPRGFEELTTEDGLLRRTVRLLPAEAG